MIHTFRGFPPKSDKKNSMDFFKYSFENMWYVCMYVLTNQVEEKNKVGYKKCSCPP